MPEGARHSPVGSCNAWVLENTPKYSHPMTWGVLGAQGMDWSPVSMYNM